VDGARLAIGGHRAFSPRHGDRTTTVLIVTAATLDLFRKMKMKMVYLAMLIVIPNSILNFLPWGGPLARVMSALDIEVTDLFPALIPSIAAAMVYVFVMATVIGREERRRLGWTKESGVITEVDVTGVIEDLKARNVELKRPKLFWVNLVMTLAIMTLLITGVGNGGVLFMVGTAIALLINYPRVDDQRVRLSEAGADAMGPVVVIFAACALMGILNGSGMSQAIADNMISWLPESWGSHIPILFAVIALPGGSSCPTTPSTSASSRWSRPSPTSSARPRSTWAWPP
jgi:CitMHS family citrate-Mg2+:H+ or citrate-Ca2+:H+ symporter